MILKYFSAMWEAVAPALGNHIWQSTLFAITAGLFTFILRKNQAQARYWLWLTASVKFLIPFSLLVGVGSYLTWTRGPAGTKGSLYVAIEEVSRPFTQPTMSVIAHGSSSTAFSSLIHLLPVLLAAGPRGSLSGLKMRTWRAFSLTNCGMYVVATIWPRWSTW